LAPALLAFGLFYLYPTLEGFLVSLTRFHPLGGGVPVGWANYERALHDDLFWQTVANATAFTLVSLALSFWPPILMAIALNEMNRGKAIFRVLFLLPFVIPAIPAANLWRWMYDSGFGLFNAVLSRLPGSPQVGWLTDPHWALLSIVFMFVWKNTGWYLILYYAALQSIPEERYEAAELDGADIFHKIYHITLPHLRPVMGMLLILQVLNAFQIFTEVYVMTGGGPMRTTEVLGTYIYKTAFGEMDLGYACAMGMLMFAALFVFSTIRVARLHRTEA
jgi:multiple sugar transport system permease protein